MAGHLQAGSRRVHIISSIAFASDHMDHVQTQIPYTLIGAESDAFLYLVVT